MYKHFKDLKSIKFPVFDLRLKEPEWYTQDGVLFIDGLVVDERNMPGETLGLRRLQSGRSDLYVLRRAYSDFKSMLASKKLVFIDSGGVPFKYVKTKRAPLVHHRIREIVPKGDHSVVWFKNINYPMRIERPPLTDPIWARVLYYKGAPWDIYDYCTFKGKDTYKVV